MLERSVLKKLPVGIDEFEKIRTQGFYYVDKKMFISELLENWGEVNLFIRPRRFGKTLTMDMLKSFFEIGCNKTVFDGLKIAQEQELCRNSILRLSRDVFAFQKKVFLQG